MNDRSVGLVPRGHPPRSSVRRQISSSELHALLSITASILISTDCLSVEISLSLYEVRQTSSLLISTYCLSVAASILISMDCLSVEMRDTRDALIWQLMADTVQPATLEYAESSMSFLFFYWSMGHCHYCLLSIHLSAPLIKVQGVKTSCSV